MKNIKHFLSVFCFVCLATMLVACKSTSVVPPTAIETIITKTVKEVIRDTVFETKKDSSYYKAYLKCLNGKVILSPKSKVQSQKGKYLQPPSVNIKDNILQVDCRAEAQKLFAQWKDIYRENMKSVLTTKYVPVEKQLSWWQTTQIWCGRLFLLVLFAFALGTAYRTYKNV
jgi:hypothetical protein